MGILRREAGMQFRCIVAPLNLEFLGGVEDVAFRVFPIDVMQGEVLGIAVHELLRADP
jgi:hypothetical protein